MHRQSHLKLKELMSSFVGRLRGRKRSNFTTEKISLNLPFGLGGITLHPNKAEQRAAWSLYVELTTRVAIQPFAGDTGLMRGVLDSLYSLFKFTRKVLIDAGPIVARTPDSFGSIAISILTNGLHPFTNKWHHILENHEAKLKEGTGRLKHEQAWSRRKEMEADLKVLRREMRTYAEVLAKIANANMSDSIYRE